MKPNAPMKGARANKKHQRQTAKVKTPARKPAVRAAVEFIKREAA